MVILLNKKYIYESWILNWDTWNHTTVYKSFRFNWNTWYCIIVKLFVLKIDTWCYNCLLTIIESYLKRYNVVQTNDYYQIEIITWRHLIIFIIKGFWTIFFIVISTMSSIPVLLLAFVIWHTLTVWFIQILLDSGSVIYHRYFFQERGEFAQNF